MWPIAPRTCFHFFLLGFTCFSANCSKPKEPEAPGKWVAGLAILEPRAFEPGPKFLAVSVFGANDNRGGCVVKENGDVSYYSHNPRGDKGSTGGPPLTREVLARLRALLGTLPSSATTPPPDDRKLVIQCFQSNSTQAFGYDLANAPEIVLEILRLSGSHIGAWTLKIDADGEWQAHHNDDGAMAVLEKTNQLVTCASYQPLRVWDCKTHQLVREIVFPVPRSDSARQLSVSPDGHFIALTGSRCIIMETTSWQVSARIEEMRVGSSIQGYNSPMFLPDGSHLFLRTHAPVSGFYESGTWKPVARPKALLRARSSSRQLEQVVDS